MINNNYMPKKGSRRASIVETFEAHGGMSFEIFLRKCGDFAFSKEWDLKGELNKLVKLGCLDCRDDVYFPKNRTDMVVMENIVPSREALPFKPLNTFLPKESPRGQPIEQRNFKNCKSNIRIQNPNNL